MSELVIGTDAKPRCGWCGDNEQMQAYHDHEWGYPVADDQRLFEMLCLESFQSGLSWRTILAKREHFRAAFADFEFDVIARFGEQDVERLLLDGGIVRHRGKIEAVINNAKRAQEMVAEFGALAGFFWRYEPEANTLAAPQSVSSSEQSQALSKALKKRGWSFVGPTTIYSLMQSMGLVNDHLEGCVFRAEVDAARRAFARPIS